MAYLHDHCTARKPHKLEIMSRRSWTDYVADRHVQPALFDPPAQPKRRRPGTVKPRQPKEVDLQRVILKALQLHPLVARIERTNTGAGRFVGQDGKAGRFVRYGFKGQADLTGLAKDGRHIAIEVKRPQTRNALRPDQRVYLDQVREAGGIAGVATCVEEAFALVEGMDV